MENTSTPPRQRRVMCKVMEFNDDFTTISTKSSSDKWLQAAWFQGVQYWYRWLHHNNGEQMKINTQDSIDFLHQNTSYYSQRIHYFSSETSDEPPHHYFSESWYHFLYFRLFIPFYTSTTSE